MTNLLPKNTLKKVGWWPGNVWNVQLKGKVIFFCYCNPLDTIVCSQIIYWHRPAGERGVVIYIVLFYNKQICLCLARQLLFVTKNIVNITFRLRKIEDKVLKRLKHQPPLFPVLLEYNVYLLPWRTLILSSNIVQLYFRTMLIGFENSFTFFVCFGATQSSWLLDRSHQVN